jgi:hypothetical protein
MAGGVASDSGHTSRAECRFQSSRIHCTGEGGARAVGSARTGSPSGQESVKSASRRGSKTARTTDESLCSAISNDVYGRSTAYLRVRERPDRRPTRFTLSFDA